ncbi:hypothetical protein MRX96_023696 [Rhipicephalus microplus]
MMHRSDDFMMAYSDELKASALEIPCLDGRTSMVVLLADSYDGLAKLEKPLNADNLLHIPKSLTRRTVINFPKFKLEHSVALKKNAEFFGDERSLYSRCRT